MATIYRKTAKGQTEIDTRAHRLAPRLRTVLILVDGKRSSDELRPLLPQQADETLATLLEQGFIEMLAELAEPKPRLAEPKPRLAEPALSTTAGPGLEPPPASAFGKPFEQLRREAVRAFNDQVGPMAEALAMRMERARSLDELRPLLETARQIIGNSRGVGAAQQFAEQFAR